MPKVKQLPKPRTRYYVGEPVIVLPLANYERMINHLTDVDMLDRKTQQQQAGVLEKNRMLLREGRTNLKAAREYYKISAAAELQA